MDSGKIGNSITPGLNGNASVEKNRASGTKIDKSETKKTDSNKEVNLNLSEKGKEILEARNKALSIAKATSPIREDRVTELKKRIDSGTYAVDPGQIADGMLREAIMEELANNPS